MLLKGEPTLPHAYKLYSYGYMISDYRIVQNFRGTKLSWLGHHVSIRRITFAFASQVLKHFEICEKTFAVQAKTVKTAKVFALECFVLPYGAKYWRGKTLANGLF